MKTTVEKTKKLLSFLLILSLALTLPFLSSCGGGKDVPDSDPEETTGEEVAEEPIEHIVGFIYNGTVKNSTHNLIMENARNQLERNLGVATYFIEDVYVKNFIEAVDLFIERGVTIIISGNRVFEHVVERAAKDNPDINFISFGNSSTRLNLTNFLPLLYQPANVCGLAAAYNSDSDTLGIVADNRMFNCAGVINAYIQGAKEVPSAHFATYVNYASSGNEADVKAAIDDLVSKGNDTIMLYLSTDYGIKYCEQIGVKVIAFSGNLPELAPNNYITGFYFNVDSYITEQVRFIQNEYFMPMTTIGEMVTGHVQMIKLNSTVTEGTSELTDLLYNGINNNDKVFEGKITDNFGTVMVQSGVTLTFFDVLEIDWLDYSVGSNFKEFSGPVPEFDLPPLVIKGTKKD